MFSEKKLKNILVESNILSEEVFDKYTQEAKKEEKKIQDYLIEKKIITSLFLYESAANYYKIPFVELKNKNIRKDVLFLIPEPIATTHKIISFDMAENLLSVAATNPNDLEIFEFLKKKTGLKLKVYLTTPDSIKEVLKQYHKSLKAEFDYLSDKKTDDKDLKKLAADLPVVRIKILANLKVDEHRLPQDGRFKISSPEHKVAFRVSIIPTFDGEKIVLRLLRESAQSLTLEQLGLQSRPFEVLKRNISKPHGIILVTGPTGSGKTTTLYTILNILNKPEVNISTIEDPIEYRMQHINQSQVNTKIGYTFASGLRAFLRQDPDIIMVGEIRDQETAEIAVHAAMTGHLVLSTIHTNNAATRG